jgi:hypothetical protein
VGRGRESEEALSVTENLEALARNLGIDQDALIRRGHIVHFFIESQTRLTMKHPLIYFRNLAQRAFQNSLLARVVLDSRPLASSRPIHLVCATRLNEVDFWQKSAVAKCLNAIDKQMNIMVHVHYSNQLGLPTIYNAHIRQASTSDILLFIHDDAVLNDINWPTLVRVALGNFDIVGVAGNIRLQDDQPAWHLTPATKLYPNSHWDHGYLSGEVGYLVDNTVHSNRYGPTPVRCSVLDGVFIAVDCAYLKRTRVLFDEQFPFHFYDVDFCRAAGRAGLIMGTWPISLAHMSAGAFSSPEWKRCWGLYQQKWNASSANTRRNR